MSYATAYWIVMLVWLIGGGVYSYDRKWLSFGGTVLFVLFCIIGYVLFGAPIHR